MAHIPISLCMIVKNSEKHITRVLNSIKEYVDEIVIVDTGSTDLTKELVASTLSGCNYQLLHFDWIDDFSAARQFSFDNATNDVVIWLDDDDEFMGGEHLRDLVDKHFSEPRRGGFLLRYDYAHDEYGNCVTRYPRERVVRKSWFRWEAPIHETLSGTRWSEIVRIDKIWVKHHATMEDIERSKERNVKILQDEFDENPDDPRTMYYLAAAHCGLGNKQVAIELLELYITKSGRPDEKYQAHIRLSNMYREERQLDKARKAANNAMDLQHDWPEAYFCLAYVESERRQYERAIHWLELGLRQPIPKTTLICNPMDYHYNPLIYLYAALFHTGRTTEAISALRKALEFRQDPSLKTDLENFLKFQDEVQLTVSFQHIKKTLEDNGEEEKLPLFASSLPKEVWDWPGMEKLRNYAQPLSQQKTVAIFCGESVDTWSPLSVASGIGGSEEAVINISKELTKLGWHVTVYNYPAEGEEGEYEGVTYKPYWSYDPERYVDVFIAWRNPIYLDAPGLTAGFKVLWLHDMQKEEHYGGDILDKVDKVMVLSEFHRDNVSYIPDDKIWISRNGIDPMHFVHRNNEPHRLIYASSPDRGLEVVLNRWEAIKKAVPEAELHVYYGFTATFDEHFKDNPEVMRWKEQVLEMLKQDGITFHGMVGHLELADSFCKSGVWAYPTGFPEISCITAMKAQAAGATPVCTDFAALEETIRNGVVINLEGREPYDEEVGEEWEKAIVSTLKNPPSQEERDTMSADACSFFGWSTVADEWSQYFTDQLGLVKHEVPCPSAI